MLCTSTYHVSNSQGCRELYIARTSGPSTLVCTHRLCLLRLFRLPRDWQFFLACRAPSGTVRRPSTRGLQCMSCTLPCQQTDSLDHKGPHMPRTWGSTWICNLHPSPKNLPQRDPPL